MAIHLLSIHLLCLSIAGLMAEPAPGRVPKVYNALITSNQNLEPSKAYPVYQPVLHDATFAFPFQPAVFYGGDFSNSLLPAPALPPKIDTSTQLPPAPSLDTSTEGKIPSPDNLAGTPEPSNLESENDNKSTPTPPLPPNTESPIPLNEFGLPAQVLPLGRINPAYDGFTQVGPFTYTYPGLRFYDPYDPFNLNPYANLHPLYRPFENVLAPNAPIVAAKAVPTVASVAAAGQPTQTPPPEPSDLNVLNYPSKDPSIPNVPPPPLPQGGLKSDKSE